MESRICHYHVYQLQSRVKFASKNNIEMVEPKAAIDLDQILLLFTGKAGYRNSKDLAIDPLYRRTSNFSGPPSDLAAKRKIEQLKDLFETYAAAPNFDISTSVLMPYLQSLEPQFSLPLKEWLGKDKKTTQISKALLDQALKQLLELPSFISNLQQGLKTSDIKYDLPFSGDVSLAKRILTSVQENEPKLKLWALMEEAFKEFPDDLQQSKLFIQLLFQEKQDVKTIEANQNVRASKVTVETNKGLAWLVERPELQAYLSQVKNTAWGNRLSRQIGLKRILEHLNISKYLGLEKPNELETILIHYIKSLKPDSMAKQILVRAYICHENFQDIERMLNLPKKKTYSVILPKLLEEILESPTFLAQIKRLSPTYKKIDKKDMLQLKQKLSLFYSKASSLRNDELAEVLNAYFAEHDKLHPGSAELIDLFFVKDIPLRQITVQVNLSEPTVISKIDQALQEIFYDSNISAKIAMLPTVITKSLNSEDVYKTNILKEAIMLYQNKVPSITPHFVNRLKDSIEFFRDAEIHQIPPVINTYQLLKEHLDDSVSKVTLAEKYKVNGKKINTLFNATLEIMLNSKELKPYQDNLLSLLKEFRAVNPKEVYPLFKSVLFYYLDPARKVEINPANKKLGIVLNQILAKLRKTIPEIAILEAQLIDKKELKQIANETGNSEKNINNILQKVVCAIWNDSQLQALLSV